MDRKRYFMNTVKSVNYMVDDLLKAKSPATYNLKHAIGSIKSAQQELRERDIEATRLQRINKPVMPQINPRDIVTNAIQDAKTGNFYNKERVKGMNDEFDKANSGSAFNLEFDNFLGDISKSQSSLENRIATQTKVNVTLTKSQLMADHRNMLIVEDANRDRHMQLMNLAEVTNTNISNLIDFNNSKLAPFLDQGLQFYMDSIFEQRKMNFNMEELKELYKSSFQDPVSSSTLMDVSSMEKIVGSGTFDFGSYYKLVAGNLKKKFNPEKPDYIMPGSMHKLVASPISQALSAVFDWFAPKQFTNGLKSLEQTISGIPSALVAALMNIDKSEGFDRLLEKFTTSAVGKFFDLDKGGTKNILKGGITQWIREVFGFKEDMRYDISNFNKGPMQYNGMANRAITNVIPTLLGKIYTTLAGIKDDIVVDYEKGGVLQWASDKRQDIANRQENAAVAAMSDFNTEMLAMIRNINTTDETKDEILKNLGNINKWITKGNKLDYRKEGFADELVNGINGMTSEQANFFVSLFNAMPDSVMNKLPFMQHMSQLATSHLLKSLEANADANGLVMLESAANLNKEADITKRILGYNYTGKQKGVFEQANDRLQKSRKEMGVGFEDQVISARNRMEEAPISVLKSIRRILVEGLIVYPVKRIPASIRLRSKEFAGGEVIRNANDVEREDAAIKAQTSQQAAEPEVPMDNLNDPEIGRIAAARIEVSKAMKDPNSAVEEGRTQTHKATFLSRLLNAPYNAAAYMIHGFNKIVNILIYGDEKGGRKNPIAKWFEQKKEKVTTWVKDKVKEKRDQFLGSDTGKKLKEKYEKVRDWFRKPDEEGNNFASFWSDLWEKTRNTASDIATKVKDYGNNFLEEFKEGNTKIQRFLFGDKETKEGGLIHKDIQGMWQKIGFNTKKIGSVVGGGSAGYLAGLFLPGGPLLWGMIGATDRFVAASDGLKEMLFGTPDNPSKFFSKELVDAFPDIRKGTGMGIVGGVLLSSFLPGGPITGAIVGGITGAIGGYLKNQNILQKLLFGNKEKGTKGIFTKVGDLIYDHIGAPIKGWFMKQSALWTRTITKHLLTPIKYALKPIGMAFTKFSKNLANGLMNMLNKATGGAAGWISKQIGKIGSAMFGMVRGALMAIPTFASAKARGAVHAVGSTVNAVGHAAAKYAMTPEQYAEHYGADSEYKQELNAADERYAEQKQNTKDFIKQHKENRKNGVRLSDIRYQEEQQRLAEIEAAETKKKEAEATWKVINSLDELRKAADAARESMNPAVPKPTGNILLPRDPEPEGEPEGDNTPELLDANLSLKAGTTDKISNKVDIVKPTGSILLPPEEVVEPEEAPKLDEVVKLKPGKVAFENRVNVGEPIKPKPVEEVPTPTSKTFSMPKVEEETTVEASDELGKDTVDFDKEEHQGPVDSLASHIAKRISNFASKTASILDSKVITDENGNVVDTVQNRVDENTELGPVENISSRIVNMANKVSSLFNSKVVTDENGNVVDERPEIDIEKPKSVIINVGETPASVENLLGDLKPGRTEEVDEPAVQKPANKVLKPNHIANVTELKPGQNEGVAEAVQKPTDKVLKPNHIANVTELKPGSSNALQNVTPVKPSAILADDAEVQKAAKYTPMDKETFVNAMKEDLRVRREGDGADDNIVGSSDFEDKYIGEDARQQIEQAAQDQDNQALAAIQESTSLTAKILAKFTNGDSKDGKKNTLWDFIKNLGGNLLGGLKNLVTGFFKWGPLIAGGIYAVQNFLPYFTGEKTSEDIPGDVAETLSHSGAWEVMRRGQKFVGNTLRAGKNLVNKGAQYGAKAVNFVTGGKIGWVDDLAKGAKNGGKNLSKMVANGIDDGVGNIAKKAVNSDIANKVVKMLDDGLKHLCGNKQIGKFIEPVYKVAKKIFPKIGAKIAKMGATAAAKVAARTASKATIIAEAALMVNDAVTGFMDYKNILGIPNDTQWDNQMAAVCAVVRFISGFCFGLIPERWVSELILNLLGRGGELKQMQEEYDQNMQDSGFGDNAEAYAKYENPTFWTKVATAFGLSDSRREIVEGEIEALQEQLATLDPDSPEYKRIQDQIDKLNKTLEDTTNTWYESIGNFIDGALIQPIQKLTTGLSNALNNIDPDNNMEFVNENRLNYEQIEQQNTGDNIYDSNKNGIIMQVHQAYNKGIIDLPTHDEYIDILSKKDVTVQEVSDIKAATNLSNPPLTETSVTDQVQVTNESNVTNTTPTTTPEPSVTDQVQVTPEPTSETNINDEVYTGNKNNIIMQVHQAYNKKVIDLETHDKYVDTLSKKDVTESEVNEIIYAISGKGGETTKPKSVSQIVQINKEPVNVPENMSIDAGAIENAGAALSLDGEKAFGTTAKSTSKNVYQPINDYKYISSPYGNRDWDGDGKVDEFHDGLDYAAPAGTPIYAVKSGKAYYVRGDGGYNGGWGNHVRIKHNDGYETIYAHASKVNIKEGDTVSGGQKIAEVGTTGRSTGNHLHFSLYKQTKDGSRPKYGTGVNPKSYLSGAMTSDGNIPAATESTPTPSTFDAGATEAPSTSTTTSGESEGNILEQLAAEFSNFFSSIFSGKSYTPLAQQTSEEDDNTTPSDSTTTPSSSAGADLTIDDKSGLVDFAKLGSKKEKFLEAIQEGAVATYQKYKVLPSLTLSQAVHESGWGESGLAVNGKALFGIKPGSNWTGKIYTGKTTEYYDGKNATQITDAFRAYDSWDESIEDHGRFLAENPRYAEVLKAKNYKEATKAVKDAGYATDPNYTSLLNSTIEYNGLDVLDKYYVKGGVGTEPISAEEYQRLNKDEVITPKKGTLNKIDIKPRKTTDQLMLGDEDLGNGLRLKDGRVKNAGGPAIPDAGGALAESMSETLQSIESSINRYYNDMTNSINTATAVDSITKQQGSSGIDFAELMNAVKEIVVNTASTAANVSGLGSVVSQGIDSLAETISAQGVQQAATTAAAVQATASTTTTGGNSSINVFNGSVDANRQQVSNSMRDRVKRITKGN